MSAKRIYTLTAFLMAGLSLSAVSYAKPPKPTIVTVPIPGGPVKPPGTGFFQEQHMVPNLNALEAEAAEQQAASASVPPAANTPATPANGPTAPAVASTVSAPVAAAPTVSAPPRAFRTLADAAKAGVNPMPKLKPLSLGKPVKPTPHTLWTRIRLFVYAGLGLLVLLGLAYALFSPRIRSNKS